MDAASSTLGPVGSTSGPEQAGIWPVLVQLLGSFDGPITKQYIASCIDVVKRIEYNAEPQISGADLVGALQAELPIPTSASELPPSGLLGLRVNLITIVHHAEEDPIEEAVGALKGAGVDFICLPGPHDRASARQRDRDTGAPGVAVHHFQVGLPNPPSNQARALGLLK
jgi:hypothetical protein